jgi:nitroreductase
MDAIDALLNRVSFPKLELPAPSTHEREKIFAAALRAPDHGQLRPWRFLVVEGDARVPLGEVFARAAKTDNPTINDEQLERLKQLPLRAPLLVVMIARTIANEKVPEMEQIISAGAAGYAMSLAAYALGFGAIWRTGEMAYHTRVKHELGLSDGERIVGYLYIGTPTGERKNRVPLSIPDYFKNWGNPS